MKHMKYLNNNIVKAVHIKVYKVGYEFFLRVRRDFSYNELK